MSETSIGITDSRIKHVVAGMHIGPMTDLAPTTVDAVLTVAAQPGTVPDGVRHRHLPLSYQVMDESRLQEAVIWVLAQIEAQRTVLIRSERGLQRPALVAGLVILQLGGRYYDALSLVRATSLRALSDFRYAQILKERAKAILARQAVLDELPVAYELDEQQ